MNYSLPSPMCCVSCYQKLFVNVECKLIDFVHLVEDLCDNVRFVVKLIIPVVMWFLPLWIVALFASQKLENKRLKM